MTSAPVRRPLADHLLTLVNAAFPFIEYQPAKLATVRAMEHGLLKNAVSTVTTIKAFGARGRALDRRRWLMRGRSGSSR
jgi:hypothetical protein